MPETAVTNTGPPLHLAQIGLEGHLTMFARVSLSEHIREELSRRGLFERIATTLGERLGVERVTSQELQAQQATVGSLKSKFSQSLDEIWPGNWRKPRHRSRVP